MSAHQTSGRRPPGRLPLLELAVLAAMFAVVFGVVFAVYDRERGRAQDAAAVGDLLDAAAAQAYAAENDGRYGGEGLEPFGEDSLRKTYGWGPTHSEVVSVEGREHGAAFRIAVRSRSGEVLSYDPSRGDAGQSSGPVSYGP